MGRLKEYFTHPLLAGFVIASCIALFVRYGISLVLYLFHTWQVSAINTIVFYGLLFVLAKVGARGRSQRRTLRRRASDRLEAMGGESAEPSRWAGVLKRIWTLLAIFSVLWLTPALILYWMYSYPYPNQMTGVLVALLSVIASVVTLIGNDKQFPARGDRILFLTGACSGSAAVVYATLS